MKKLLLIPALLLSVFSMKASGTWMLVTDAGEKIMMNNVGMLVAADNASTFSVVLNDDAGDVIDGVSYVTFEYDAGFNGVNEKFISNSGQSLMKIGKSLRVLGCEGKQFVIINSEGVKISSGIIKSASHEIEVSDLSNGNYVLRVGNASLKFCK